jgi:hypothetical protein
MPSISWSGVKLATIELSSGNVFSGGMNHASPSGSQTEKSAQCQMIHLLEEE